MPLITQQFKLLLWKDYLIRKRKLITLAGVLWATLVISSLYFVRSNVDNYDFPTCQFPARALPSAGMLNFVQSFTCSVDNQCSPLDQFQEIPTYESSKLTQLQRKLSPLLSNDTVLETMDSVPSALKLIGSLSRAADEPTFISITQNGLRIRDIFRDSNKIQSILINDLKLSDSESYMLMAAEVSLKGIIKGKPEICDYNSLTDIILTDIEILMKLSTQLCQMKKEDIHNLFMKTIFEIDIQKYLNMLGSMYSKLNGDQRLLQLSHMLSAVLRITKLESFLPREVAVMLMKGHGEGFRYFDVGIIPKLISTLEPTFGATESYKLAKSFADTTVGALQWLYNMIQKNNLTSPLQEVSNIAVTNIRSYKDLSVELDKVSRSIKNSFGLVKTSIKDSLSLGEAFSVLSKSTSFLLKFVTPETKHDILFYSTLLAKMVEGAHDVVFKNLNMERIIYNVSLEHKDGLKIFVGLSKENRKKALEGLMDADRAFSLTSKINKPREMFCNDKRLSVFFELPKNKVGDLKSALCNDVWNSYISDLITSFGIYDVNQYISSMASLLIQETLGKDTSDQLYTPETIFKTVQDLVEDLLKIQDDGAPMDWGLLLGEEDVLMEFRERKSLGKEILITIHGTMAREIVQENIILDMKLSPILKQISYIVKTMIEQINVPDKSVLKIFNDNYPGIIETLLITSFDEEKTFNLLSWSGIDLFCHTSQNFTNTLTFPNTIDQYNLTSAMCKYSIEMEKSIKAEGFLTKTIKNINSKDILSIPLDWSTLISNLRILYSNLYENYPYLFEPASFNMDVDSSRRIADLMEESRKYWFDGSLEKTLHLGIKGIFFALDLFDPSLESVIPEIWRNVKSRLNSANGPIVIIDEIAKITIAVLNDDQVHSPYQSGLPPVTTTALKKIIPNLGQLVIDAVKLVERTNTPLQPIISILNAYPVWPCSNTSLATTLDVSDKSKLAIRNIEIMFCFNETLREEWRSFEEGQNNKKLTEVPSNTTSFKEHFFLRLSRNFDELIRDSTAVQNIITNLPEDSNPTVFDAFNTVVRFIRSEDRNFYLQDFFTKLDTVLLSINTTQVGPVSLNILWEDYTQCSGNGHNKQQCSDFGRSVWLYNLEFFSVMAESMAGDLVRYFRENNEPNANILQMVGFTRNTGLYLLYDKFVDFIGVLLNSYWDYGFMNQVRKESRTTFWDCESIVDLLVIPQGSVITLADLNRVKPYICASLLYWVSLPREENTLLDVVAKPQYYFYTMQASNLTSIYNNAFVKITELSDILEGIAKGNNTQIIKNEDLNTIENRLNTFADSLTSFKINVNNSSYKLFKEINKKQFVSSIYLTRVVKIITRIENQFVQLSTKEIANETLDQNFKADLGIILKKFKRRPTEAIALHFDVITNSIWKKENNSLVESIEELCQELNKGNHKFILADDKRFLAQICAKSYERIYRDVENILSEEYDLTKDALMKLTQVLDNNAVDDDIFKYMAGKPELTRVLSQSIKHADDTGVPLYLLYLQTTLQHYEVLVDFLTGNNWWESLRGLYGGPYADTFFNVVENGIGIFDDVVSGLDKIKLTKLLYEINYNDTEALCKDNIHLSEFIPDSSGSVDALKTQICHTDEDQLYGELPLLKIIAQVYNGDSISSNDLNYTSLETLLTQLQHGLQTLESGPKQPTLPDWITPGDLETMKRGLKSLLSKESLVKAGFGAVENLVDAVTLYFNKDCKCSTCCSMTGWLKQLNLQLYKKPEYDTLLCNIDKMTDMEISDSLSGDFHWDMSVKELLASRNYTNLELNRSINELLGLIKLYVLEDVSAHDNKLSDCLNNNVSRNSVGNFTLFLKVTSKTLKLLKIQLPHLQEIPGFKEHEFWQHLHKEIAPRLHVLLPFKELADETVMKRVKQALGDEGFDAVMKSQVDLYSFTKTPDLLNEWLIIPENLSTEFYAKHNYTAISDFFYSILDSRYDQKQLVALQSTQFWNLSFISSLVEILESTLMHVSRLTALFSRFDVKGALNGEIVPLMDAVIQVLIDESVKDVSYSLDGLVTQLYPLMKGTHLDKDLQSISQGLNIFKQIKNYVLENMDLKLKVSDIFLNKGIIERELKQIGINDTLFWTMAADNIHEGYIDLKPLFTFPFHHITLFTCNPVFLSQVMKPRDDSAMFYIYVINQFCGLGDERAKLMINVLVENVNGSYVVDKLFPIILSHILDSSNLTREESHSLLTRLPTLMELLPTVQDQFGDLTDMFNQEPVFKAFKDFNSVGGLLGSSEFMSSAGMMLCGKPFKGVTNRILKAVLKTKDYSVEPDREQLDALPTDFCRSLYTDILSMDGGKIVWSYMKPLLMGKLLYTPNTEVVGNIIREANSTFSSLAHIASLIHSLSTSFPSMEEIHLHKPGADALVTLLPAVLDVERPLDVGKVLEKIGEVKDLEPLVTKVSSLLQCLNLNRFIPMKDEYTLSREAVNLTRINEFSAGIVFMNVYELEGKPYNVEYKIRMDIDTVPTTAKLRNQLWIPGPEASFLEDMRYFRGFVQVQDLIDKAIIQLAGGNGPVKSMPSVRKGQARSKREVSGGGDWAVYTQQMPYPCYKKDYFQTSLYESQALVVALFFSLLFTVCSAIRFNVGEKESGNTMLMSVMGVNLSAHTASWFIASFTEVVLTCLSMTLVLYFGNILPRTDVSLLFVVMVNYGFSVLMFCYVITRVSSSASLSAVGGGLAVMMSFMPFVLVLALEVTLTDVHKLLTSLSMSSAFAYSIYQITKSEAMGVGAHWSSLWETDDDLSLGVTMLMVTFDAVLYLTIGYIVDLVWGPDRIRNNIIHSPSTDKGGVSDRGGVSVVDVRVDLGGGRGLRGVSVDLRRGEVTALLGHNGAGKSTLIKVISGTVRPVSGYVSVHGGPDVSVGVCPQHDVVFPDLTVDEHLALYAQLKSGGSLADCTEDINYMSAALQLGSRSGQQTRHLSGGERRRVCVALSFLNKPTLVLLDEPTTGVDPGARRDIWSMIEKLREDRTILLTTHHLDEAEILSDQVVIMHKGQIHTVGSPVEIKRSLGTGYKLIVTYPHEPLKAHSDTLLEFVRRTVHNAYLIDACGLTIELGLPFYDQHGLHTDYLTLCTLLESCRATLKYSKFSMDCCSLEQVLYNICAGVDQNDTLDVAHSSSSHSLTSASHESPSKCSVRSDDAALVSGGAISGSLLTQFGAILHKRLLHYARNKWLWCVVFLLPTLFLMSAMTFSTIRPPPDQERPLLLRPQLYPEATEFVVPYPSIHSEASSQEFAEDVMDILSSSRPFRSWTPWDNPTCVCEDAHQSCDWSSYNVSRPDMMILPDVDTANQWIVTTHDKYIEKRYTGFSSSALPARGHTAYVAWYNNKGHHALPSAINAVNSAILKRYADQDADIKAYSHPLKISTEQLSKTTIYQHIADAGIAALVLVSYSLVPAGGAAYLVGERAGREKGLQLAAGVRPGGYWAVAAVADLAVIVLNIGITACVMLAFGFPVFVARDNLPAICLLLFLFGFACTSLVHVSEKLFTEPSMSTMVVFCGNVFVGLSGMALLLILDLISESDTTDNARWVLHKIFMLSPQFVLGDALIEIAKNTVQAQVLERFGMDTYNSPLFGDVISLHYIALVLVGTALTILNLAIEYHMFDYLNDRWCTKKLDARELEIKNEGEDVVEERKRVMSQLQDNLTIPTIHNIHKGNPGDDVCMLVGATRTYKDRVALKNLTLGIPRGQCTALLGMNGAGKSTTFSLLSGERQATQGEVRLRLLKASTRMLQRGHISYCPQSDAIDMLLTVRETLVFYCKLRGIQNIDDVVKRTLELFELTKYSSVRNGALSGGNKRKLCTAIAFMGRTDLVLLDEPTSGMDPGSRACVARGVRCASGAGRGVLLSTHTLTDAHTLATRVALLDTGRLVALATVEDCLRRFGGGYVVSVAGGKLDGARETVVDRGGKIRGFRHRGMQFILPQTGTTGDLKLSEVFRLMAELQNKYDIEDYTINQSTLDEMFLNTAIRPANQVSLNMDDIEETARQKNKEIEQNTPL